jgi:hypothetical protein
MLFKLNRPQDNYSEIVTCIIYPYKKRYIQDDDGWKYLIEKNAKFDYSSFFLRA